MNKNNEYIGGTHFIKLPPQPKTPPAHLNQTHPAPQIILAGAGTGNTTTITAKIAYMVEKENIDPPISSRSPSLGKPQGTCTKKQIISNTKPYKFKNE
jgi:hypothetical protein